MENEIEICETCKSPNWRNLSHLENENPHGVCDDCGNNSSEFVEAQAEIIDHIRKSAESFDFGKIDEHHVPQPRTWAEVERKWNKMGIKAEQMGIKVEKFE
tara:strand:+ start:1588 stop:1890 length:303 start_codon:yes stop_codon:yes gene_type:complete